MPVRTLTVLLLLTAVLAGGSLDAAWHRLTDPATSIDDKKAIIASIAYRDSPGAAEFLCRYIQSATRGITFQELVKYHGSQPLQCMLFTLEQNLARFRNPRAVAVLIREIYEQDGLGRLTLLQGLKETPGAAVDTLWSYFLEHGDPRRELVAAVDAAGLRALRSAIPRLTALAGDASNRFGTRCAAIRALAYMPDIRPVPVLIECLAEKGRIGAEARNTLRTITGVQSLFSGPYREWLTANRETYIPPLAPRLHFNAELEQEEWERFYGIPVVGKRVLFICDTSASMDGPPLEGMKQELVRTLRNLGPARHFNVIFFNRTARIWNLRPPFLVPADESTIARLEQFLALLKGSACTQTADALYTALAALAPGHDLETIFLLTDGRPTDASAEEIEAHIRHMNRYLKVRIHTVFTGPLPRVPHGLQARWSAGGTSARRLTAVSHLQTLAASNDGLFRVVETAGSPESAARGRLSAVSAPAIARVIDNRTTFIPPSDEEIIAQARAHGATVIEWPWQRKLELTVSMQFTGVSLFGALDRINKKAGDVGITLGEGLDLQKPIELICANHTIREIIEAVARYARVAVTFDVAGERIHIHPAENSPCRKTDTP